MAHFARLDNQNIVQEVIVIDNNDAPTEEAGIEFIKNVLKLEGAWIQTSYNANIRGKYAEVMDIYDPKKDKFITNVAYIEEQKKLNIENQEKLLAARSKKEALAEKLGITVEELDVLIK